MIDGLQFVIRHVDDVDAARAFYHEQMGLKIDTDSPNFVQFSASNGAAFGVSKVTNSSDLPLELWWVVDDVDATCAALAAKGAEIVDPLQDEPFGRTAAFKDTTGGYVHLLQLPKN